MKPSSVLLPLFFVFALLFAQQGAAVHGIAHALAEQTQDPSLPHDKHCDLCATYAQIGSAIGIDPVHFDFPPAAASVLDTHLASHRPAAFTAFGARAPPHHT